MDASNIALYQFQVVNNGLGVWVTSWALSLEDAERSRQGLIDMDPGYYKPVEAEEMDGGEGQVGPVFEVRVELTPLGLLAFSNRHAISDDPMC